jgi:hypothetical protein
MVSARDSDSKASETTPHTRSGFIRGDPLTFSPSSSPITPSKLYLFYHILLRHLSRALFSSFPLNAGNLWGSASPLPVAGC